MSLFSSFFYRRPPDGLLEFIDRVYVFDSCFSTEVLSDELYHMYLHEIIMELHEEYADSSFLAFNFREGEKRSNFAEILCQYDVTVLNYPRHYEGCPILPISLVRHFLHIMEHCLSLGDNQNIILLHCERGGWPLLAFLLASLLTFRKVHSGDKKTLEMVHREAPKGLLQLLAPLNPFPSQLRYLQYVSRKHISPEWPPVERAVSLDCLLKHFLRFENFSKALNGLTALIMRLFGLHWVKVTRTMQGSLWADSQRQEDQSRAPEIHYSELESLFSVSVADGSGTVKDGHRHSASTHKLEIVHLVSIH